MKTKGIVLIVLGVLGAIFVSLFDVIMRKPANIIGPKSVAALVVCGLLVVAGVLALKGKCPCGCSVKK